MGIIIYPTHWIKYGNGKVAIRRVSKECVDGRPVGKWKIREDEFLLEETEGYGMSWQVLGEELRKYGLGGWLPYMDEDSYKDRLHILAEAIIEHGLDLLEKMSHEEETIPTKAMAETLFQQHRKLADEFEEKFDIKIVLERPEDVDELFDSIKK